ncbi:hypothetical protein C8N47_10533 [Mangrovibacterium marinum]|uniref:Uncharacterized protein n=2 Tax=Mangrovibacterium marinum TaxID=1639118 RepID=A0A2T5C348_9BACT|nr:hypothetical protein C8N47_10533 [Mangrovibacterium marinum]
MTNPTFLYWICQFQLMSDDKINRFYWEITPLYQLVAGSYPEQWAGTLVCGLKRHQTGTGNYCRCLLDLLHWRGHKVKPLSLEYERENMKEKTRKKCDKEFKMMVVNLCLSGRRSLDVGNELGLDRSLV